MAANSLSPEGLRKGAGALVGQRAVAGEIEVLLEVGGFDMDGNNHDPSTHHCPET